VNHVILTDDLKNSGIYASEVRTGFQECGKSIVAPVRREVGAMLDAVFVVRCCCGCETSYIRRLDYHRLNKRLNSTHCTRIANTFTLAS
jgi:hypothetical protein